MCRSDVSGNFSLTRWAGKRISFFVKVHFTKMCLHYSVGLESLSAFWAGKTLSNVRTEVKNEVRFCCIRFVTVLIVAGES